MLFSFFSLCLLVQSQILRKLLGNVSQEHQEAKMTRQGILETIGHKRLELQAKKEELYRAQFQLAETEVAKQVSLSSTSSKN